MELAGVSHVTRLYLLLILFSLNAKSALNRTFQSQGESTSLAPAWWPDGLSYGHCRG